MPSAASLFSAPLSKPLRTQLENTVKAARDRAETAARAALAQLAVTDATAPDYLSEAQRVLRRKLRSHARSLSASSYQNNSIETRQLVWEVAYEHWHRMLFARFLAESGLLMWEPGAAVSLDDCRDMVDNHPDMAMGAKSQWELAGKLAARMLPQVFKPQSPVFEMTFAPEHQLALEKLLAGLPTEVFQASDSLGWVYQFWQAKRKDEVNASEVKIGADELSAVTQLFTEPYMVDFLLHNSLGAWWATRHPDQPCPVPMPYLRTVPADVETAQDCHSREGGNPVPPIPAAGKFEGWPDSLADFKLLDPCCGSGHFLVAAFLLLVPMRMAAEGLTAMDAVDFVLQDNLHGLELDARCVEIAVFALALTAWRYPDADGNPLGVRADMPAPQVACCGLQVAASAEDWVALIPDALSNKELVAQELRALHADFMQSPLLGSLLDPSRSQKHDLAHSQYGNSFDALRELMEQALARETAGTAPIEGNDDRWNIALNARGMFDAARLLDARYHLVVTNVPYLAAVNQSHRLKEFCKAEYPKEKNDLAVVFLARCLKLTKKEGRVALVTKQDLLYKAYYKKARKSFLLANEWNLTAILGSNAFEAISGEEVKAILTIIGEAHPNANYEACLINVAHESSAALKAVRLPKTPLFYRKQQAFLDVPDCIISTHAAGGGQLLGDYCTYQQGICTGDYSRFGRSWWEFSTKAAGWVLQQSTVNKSVLYGGLENLILWADEKNSLREFVEERVGMERVGSWLRGEDAWGKNGIAVSSTGELATARYMGGLYDDSTMVLIPEDEAMLPAIFMYCSSNEYRLKVRELDSALKVRSALIKVPFDLAHWQQVAAERYPDGLPKPYSDDPTQWLFHGHPFPATDPLQVAVARLVGYRWPAEQQATPTAPAAAEVPAQGEFQAKSASSPIDTCATSYQIESIDLPTPAPEKAAMELSDAAHAWIARCTALTEHTDDDGIVCLPSVRGEPAAHDRLLKLLIAAWETVQPGSWKPAVLDKLLAEADCAGKGLDTWLREKFFEQHAKRFHHRPFVWHVWDGVKDGFAALVNYHLLDAKNLDRLIHTYLGDWIRQQEACIANGGDGAQLRLSAAQDLKRRLLLIQEGEYDGKTGHDIFVRWKSLAEQPLGWTPDLNDGVRLNIRPFMTLEVLRHNKKPKLNITWDKDRGKDVESAPWFKVFGGERINDHHLTLAEKMAAQEKKA